MGQPVKSVRVWVRGRSLPPWLSRLLQLTGITGGLLGAGIMVGVCVWTSAVIIVRPHPPPWLTRVFPGVFQPWGDRPVRSWDAIQAELQAQGYQAGPLINLAHSGTDKQLDTLRLLPVLTTRAACSQNCEAIAELRLYGVSHPSQDGMQLQLLHQLTVQGPPERQVIGLVERLNGGAVSSSQPLPLVDIKPLYEERLPGGWLTLTGRWHQQGSPILYGQMLHVDVQSLQITSLLNWSSPPGRLPTWHNVDSTNLPELVVNQSLGLEPQFNLYTIANAPTTRLNEVSLSQVSIFPQSHQSSYRDALFLAHHGLWSEAHQRLVQLKAQLAEQWPLRAEQQLQLVAIHARISRSQAERDWSRPGQKLLAFLLDGQWEAALTALDQPQTPLKAATLPTLEQNSVRLWQRLTASLQLNPNQTAARIWGALLLLAKEDQASALQWLTQTQHAALKSEFVAIAASIQAAASTSLATGLTPASPPTATASQQHTTEGLFGTAQGPVTPTLQAWSQPAGASDLTLPAGDQWYEIALSASHTDQRWQPRFPTPTESNPAAIAALWQSLGLQARATLDLIAAPSGETVHTVEVKAIRWQANAPTLLASGPPSPGAGPWIVATPGQWQPPTQVTARSLASVAKEEPGLGDRLLTTLSRYLGETTTTALSAALKTGQGGGGFATVRRVDFTEPNAADILLTLDPRAAGDTGLSLPSQTKHHLITNVQGELLYSDAQDGQSQTLIGWLKSTTGAMALVTQQGTAFRLQTWSPQQQQFQ